MAHPWQATVQDQTGNIMALAEITVRNGGPLGSLATIYSDDSGTAKANPFDADANGLAQFWAETGIYYIEGALGGQTTDGWYISLGGGSAVLTVTAAEAIGGLKAVTSDGYLCDIADVDKLGGISQAAGAIGEGVNLVTSGPLIDGGWTWTADQPIFVADDGELTQTDPGNSRRVAWAVSDTEISVDIFPTGTASGGSGKEGELVFTNASGKIADSLLNLADPAADPKTDNSGKLPALAASGLLPLAYVPLADPAADPATDNDGLIPALDANGQVPSAYLPEINDPRKQFTANGAITAGKPMGIDVAGTASQIAEVAGTFGYTDEGSFATEFGVTGPDYDGYDIAYDPTSEQWCIVYMAGTTLYAVVFTYDGATFTKGTPVSVATSVNGYVAVRYHPFSDVFVIGYKNAIVAASIGTLTITLGSAATPGMTAAESIRMACSSADNTFLYAARDNTTVDVVAGSISGTAITLGSVAAASPDNGHPGGVEYHAGEDKYVIIYAEIADDDIKGKVATLSGLSVSFGAEYTVYAGDNAFRKINTAIDASDTILVGYEATGNVNTFVALTVSGTAITVGTAAPATSGAAGQQGVAVAYDTQEDQFVFGYMSTTTQVAYVGRITLSGTTITIVDEDTTTATTSNSSSSEGRAAYGGGFAFYLPFRTTADITLVAIDPATPTTNADTFFAFCKATVADTETVTADTVGAINTDQSGLTKGAKYYLAADGTLTTTATEYGIVAKAMSATAIEVTRV